MSAILKGPYAKQALVPSSEWLDKTPPARPTLSMQDNGEKLTVSWMHADYPDVFHWIVYAEYNNRWQYTILNRSARSLDLDKTLPNATSPGLQRVIVTAVDRTGNESSSAEMGVKDKN